MLLNHKELRRFINIMKVYVFGNRDVPGDNNTFLVASKLKSVFNTLEFVEISPNQDLEVSHESRLVILDAIEGLEQVDIFTEKELDNLILSPRSSVHDFDLGFQLRYLKKLGKLNKVTIIGLPMKDVTDKDYLRIQLILRKLVAQDMQGS